MSEFISEPIQPRAGSFDASSMGRGEPGLPRAFAWRSSVYEICAQQRVWKESAREGRTAGGELYLRRHYYRLLMSDDSIWTVYFVRQTSKSGDPRARWFLYTLERG